MNAFAEAPHRDQFLETFLVTNFQVLGNTNQELKDAMNYGTIILHSPTGSIVYDGVEEYTTNVDYLNNINVLGLGDRFAATVLNYMTISKLHISDLVNRSHMDMTTWLERR